MKESNNQHIGDYLKGIESGSVPNGYQELMTYLKGVRMYFKNQYPSKFTVGSFYQGYMDLSYFSITTEFLKEQKLKIGLVFNHEKARFEIWLLGQNKEVQKKHWDRLNQNKQGKYTISNTGKDAIIKHVLVDKPNFNEVDLLTQKIDQDCLAFFHDIQIMFSI